MRLFFSTEQLNINLNNKNKEVDINGMFWSSKITPLQESSRELIVYYNYMGHLIQLSLVLAYLIEYIDFIKGQLW